MQRGRATPGWRCTWVLWLVPPGGEGPLRPSGGSQRPSLALHAIEAAEEGQRVSCGGGLPACLRLPWRALVGKEPGVQGGAAVRAGLRAGPPHMPHQHLRPAGVGRRRWGVGTALGPGQGHPQGCGFGGLRLAPDSRGPRLALHPARCTGSLASGVGIGVQPALWPWRWHETGGVGTRRWPSTGGVGVWADRSLPPSSRIGSGPLQGRWTAHPVHGRVEVIADGSRA